MKYFRSKSRRASLSEMGSSDSPRMPPARQRRPKSDPLIGALVIQGAGVHASPHGVTSGGILIHSATSMGWGLRTQAVIDKELRLTRMTHGESLVTSSQHSGVATRQQREPRVDLVKGAADSENIAPLQQSVAVREFSATVA